MGTLLDGVRTAATAPPSPSPAPAIQPTPQSTPATISLSGLLGPDERLVRYRNGCNGIFYAWERAAETQQTSWFGNCRAGLADGSGLLLYQAPNTADNYVPVTMRLGRPAMFYDVTSEGMRTVSLMRAPGREAYEAIAIATPFVRARDSTASAFDARSGEGALFILAQAIRQDSTRYATDRLWAERRQCPANPDQSVSSQLAGENYAFRPALTPAQRARVVPICTAAWNRLRAEGRAPASFSFSSGLPFDAVDYGYYFVVYLEHTVAPLAGQSQPAANPSAPEPPRYTDIALCPQITALAGCEPVWQALLAPFISRRDALKAIGPGLQAEAEADRTRRFHSLVAAEKTRLMAAATRVAAAYRPPSPLPAATPRPAGRIAPPAKVRRQ